MVRTKDRTAWPRQIGILGGLGPHAHLELERRLLAAVDAAADQDYPGWLLASVPGTPDRTRALVAGGPSPVPSLVEGLERLKRGGADFAVIPCMTAHAFLDDVRRRVSLPVLSLVELTVETIAERHGPTTRVGLLATSGTLESGLFPATAKRRAPGLRWLTPLGLPDGKALQEDEVMRPIYGARRADGRRGGGIKGGEERDPETGRDHREVLNAAGLRLAEHGADVVISGCTEISLALGRELADGTPVVDPLDVAVQAVLDTASGRRAL